MYYTVEVVEQIFIYASIACIPVFQYLYSVYAVCLLICTEWCVAVPIYVLTINVPKFPVYKTLGALLRMSHTFFKIMLYGVIQKNLVVISVGVGFECVSIVCQDFLVF